ncbi:MAG: cytochrome c [Pseudohongiella sp.]|nr:cytochrome c [Pseudohongiella sp.]
MDKKSLGVGVGLGIAGILLLVLVLVLTIAYSGAYNIAATEDHTPFVRWAFATTMHNSVRDRAADTNSPPEFSEAMVEKGTAQYKAMCQHCHAGPGVQRSEWAKGMLPQPPHLVDKASEWEPNEIFWLVKHGVKMTGMPAFGPTHNDDILWSIAAFVRELPGMTAQEYAAYDGEGSGDSQGH